MIVEELQHVPPGKRTGPIIVCEYSQVPWRHNMFGVKWRAIASAVGVPAGVQNRDSRAGGITEAADVGVPLDSIRRRTLATRRSAPPPGTAVAPWVRRTKLHDSVSPGAARTGTGVMNDNEPKLTRSRVRGRHLSRIMYPAPRMVCSSGCVNPLSILERSREMCTSMTLVCGSK